MRSIDYHILTEHMDQPGCVVCHLINRAAHKRMDSLFNEYVADIETNTIFRDARGLCTPHAWQAKENFHGYVTGIAVLTHASLDEVLRILEKGGARGLFGRDQRATNLEPVAPCPICTAMDEAEVRFSTAFATHFTDEDFHPQYMASEGLCVAHLRTIIPLMNDPDPLIEDQAAKWAALRDGLWAFLNEPEARQTNHDILMSSIRALSGVKSVRRNRP